MNFDLISFDIQGTITNAAFGDEFWFEALPKLYAKAYEIEPSMAKQVLKEQFQDMGKYDKRYYSVQYWLDALNTGLTEREVFPLIKQPVEIFPEMRELLTELNGRVPMIAISSTTRAFVERELGDAQRFFQKTISTLDDLQIAGKPQEVFEMVDKQFGIEGKRCLHIGDSLEMDVLNARKAGWQSFYFEKKRSREEMATELKQLIG